MPKAIQRPKPDSVQADDMESVPSLQGIDRFVQRHELTMIVVLCILAALRVLVFSAAYPVFTNVDEPAHYDLAVKYALGRIPYYLEAYSPESAEVLAWHSSPEYLVAQKEFDAGRVMPPLETLPPDVAGAVAQRNVEAFANRTNVESTQPPVYYAAAGIWYRLGELLGLTDVRLVFWIRYLNVLIYGLMVWAAYAFIRRLYPGNRLLRVGVPLLLAFFPQDVFYQISNDVLTPLLFAAAFYLLLRVYLEDSRSTWLHVAAGLSVAAVFLVKISNITILVPLALVLFAVLRRARAEGRLKESMPRIAVLASAAVIPCALWLARNYSETGDLLGTSEKASYLGWSCKPLPEVFHHPVFTPGGAYTFVSGLITTFWRGEIVWHLDRIAMPSNDIFYVVSTLLFVGGAVAAFLWKRQPRPAGERFAGWMGVWAIGASVAVMLGLSMIFDFGDCFYPSAEHPYLTSGRLMSGVLVPFLVLYVTGLDFLMTRMRLKFSRLWVLLAIVAGITACETMMSLKVFPSPYNWFHL